MPMTIEESLVEAARGGDAAALDRLIVRCRPGLRRYAMSQCSTSSDVDDAVQETLIILYRRLPALRSLGAFTGWLFMIVRRECRRLSRMMLHQEVPLDETAERRYLQTRTDPDLRTDIVMAIQSLPDIYRDVIILRDLEELTIREIAERLNMVPETVKTRIHRGRHLIREHLLT